MFKNKIIIWSIIILMSLIFIDLGLTFYVNGSFVVKHYMRSPSKSESRKREMLIEEDLEIIPTGDSILFSLKDFEIWRDNFLIIKQIGISPFHYTTKNDSLVVINISALKEKKHWLISFDGKELQGFGDPKSSTSKVNDTVRVQFYYAKSGDVKEIGSIKIIP